MLLAKNTSSFQAVLKLDIGYFSGLAEIYIFDEAISKIRRRKPGFTLEGNAAKDGIFRNEMATSGAIFARFRQQDE